MPVAMRLPNGTPQVHLLFTHAYPRHVHSFFSSSAQHSPGTVNMVSEHDGTVPPSPGLAAHLHTRLTSESEQVVFGAAGSSVSDDEQPKSSVHAARMDEKMNRDIAAQRLPDEGGQVNGPLKSWEDGAARRVHYDPAMSSSTRPALVFLIAAIAVQGCTKRSARDATAQDLLRVEQSLQGSWVLVDAQPNPPLDGVLLTLLRMQLGKMVLTFDHGTMTAKGQGIQFQRYYRVIRWEGFGRAHVELRDNVGDSDEVEGTFEGDTIRFTGLDDPWRGTGVVKRLQP